MVEWIIHHTLHGSVTYLTLLITGMSTQEFKNIYSMGSFVKITTIRYVLYCNVWCMHCSELRI